LPTSSTCNCSPERKPRNSAGSLALARTRSELSADAEEADRAVDIEAVEGQEGRSLEFDRYFDRLGKLLRDLLFVVPPNLTLREAPRWLGLAGRLRGWRGSDVAELVRLFTMSGADLLDEWLENGLGPGTPSAGSVRRA
jgi:hypothetical protein